MDDSMDLLVEDAELLAVFMEEAHDQLQVVDSGLVQLEQDPTNVEVIQAIFRAAHTLKSSSAAMGLIAVSELTHAMEDVLDEVRHGALVVNTDIIDTLLRGLDVLNGIIGAIESKTSTQDLDDKATSLSVDLRALAGRNHGVASTGESATSVLPADTHADVSNQQCAVLISVVPDCQLPDIRFMMALRELQGCGEVTSSSPNGSKLLVNLITDLSDDEIKGSLSTVGEISWIRIARGAEASSLTVDGTAPEIQVKVESSEPIVVTNNLTKTQANSGATTAQAAVAPTASNTIRVRVDTLDHLMNLVGELVLDRTRLSQLCDTLRTGASDEAIVAELDATVQHLGNVVSDIHEDVLQARMLPLKELFKRFPRTVRDLSHNLGKEVDLRISGEEELLDRSVIEKLVDPLTHIIRNALDHGMETPDERVAKGKPAKGVVQLSAWRSESHVLIEVSDDGPGINCERLKEKAVESGMITQSYAASMSTREAFNLIFIPGLSSAKTISDVSGRGVGMDVVKKSIETLGGSIQVESEPGAGSIFQLKIPLTLAIIRALLVQVGQIEFALPLTAVEETVSIAKNMVKTVRGRGLLPWRNHVVPVVLLSEVFPGCGEFGTKRTTKTPLVVVNYAGQEACLAVDAILGHQEIVVKSLSPYLGDVKGLAGVTILGNGRVALIIDLGRLFEDGMLADTSAVGVNSED